MFMGKILVKVHESYRMVVAVCDEEVFGRKLVDSGVRNEEPGTRSQELGARNKESVVGRRVLDVSGVFFKGEAMSYDEAKEEVLRCAGEDATFNFVGRESVLLAKELGLVWDSGVREIDGVEFALVLM